MKIAIVAAAGLTAAVMCTGGAAQATPAALIQVKPKLDSSGLAQVHWRGYRHCHWRHGDRWCHGGGHWRGSGIYLDLGGRRHHRWDRDGDNDHWRNRRHRRDY